MAYSIHTLNKSIYIYIYISYGNRCCSDSTFLQWCLDRSLTKIHCLLDEEDMYCRTEDIADKPSRDAIKAALEEADKPDAEIDDPDIIPDSVGKKRNAEGSDRDSEASQKKRKTLSVSESSSSSSSTSSSSNGNAKGVSVEDKKAVAEDKKISVSSDKTKKVQKPVEPKGRGRGSGRGGPKLLDTSNVKPHIDPIHHRQSIDEGDMKDRQTTKAAARKKRG